MTPERGQRTILKYIHKKFLHYLQDLQPSPSGGDRGDLSASAVIRRVTIRSSQAMEDCLKSSLEDCLEASFEARLEGTLETSLETRGGHSAETGASGAAPRHHHQYMIS